MTKNLVFFLEGHSEKVLLQDLIPRLLREKTCGEAIHVDYIAFNGKQDMENKLPDRLKYWLKSESVFVVLLDQDKENCKKLKKRLLDKYRNECNVDSSKLLIRIACCELESWYFGDLTAVETALKLNSGKLTRYKNKSKYRKPDKIQKPSEELSKITNEVYQKISGSRAVGSKLSLDNNTNTSPGFQSFIKGVRKLLQSHF